MKKISQQPGSSLFMTKFILLKEKPALCTLFLLLVFTMLSCSKDSDDDSTGTTGATVTIDSVYTTGTAEGSFETASDDDDLVENSDFSNTISIQFGSTVTVSNPLENAGVSVSVSGHDVEIISTVSGVAYELSGTTANGSVKFYSDNKFKLTLNGVSVTNSDGPAINIQSEKRAFVVLADGTENNLTDGSTYTDTVNGEDSKGTLFSEGQIIFSGSGRLTVTGNYKHAIVSDDYVRIRSGVIVVSGAVTDGIHTNDAFIADGGTITITAASDGIECEEGYIVINDGVFDLKTGDDGITASYEEGDTSIDPFVNINGGSIQVTSSAGEGIESKSSLTINNGYIVLQTADDAINAGTAIYINGGSVYAYSTSNDGIDSNGSFTLTGGRVVAVGARSPEAGIDSDARQLKLTGGIIVSIGGATSMPSSTTSTVPSVIMGGGSAGQIVHIESDAGEEVLTFMAPVSYSTLLFAGSKLKTATSYAVYTGGSVASGTEFYGFYTSGTYTKGSSSTTFTASSLVTQLGGTISRG